MRALGRAVVSSAVLGIAMMSGQGVASAQVLPSLDVEIRLDAGAPTTGELIRGLRSIEGIAEAIEGIRRVDLYVVPAGLTRDISSAVPVDSFTSDVPLNKADFDLEWDSSTTTARLVDIVVVARSATRTGQLEIPGVRVDEARTAAAEPVAAPKPKPKAPTTAAAGTPSVTRAVSGSGRSTTALASGSRRVALRVNAPEVGEAQASSFYAVYGQLPFAASATADAAARPALTSAPETTRGAWPYVAAGVVLIVTAGHAQRVVHGSGRRF